MKIYADESGNFSWSPPKPSVFVALIVLDREELGILARFHTWKQEMGVSGKTEVKGADQSDEHLARFATLLFPENPATPRLIAVGVDTAVTKEETVLAVKAQVAEQFAHVERLVERMNPANRTLIQSYREMPGWIRRRSSANVLWISALEELLRQTLQSVVVVYGEEEFDDEFSDIQINIDRSFIKEYRHETFWKEWLRNGFSNRRHRPAGFSRPREWRERKHPFMQNFSRGKYLDFTSLLQQGTQFRDSKRCEGVQIADVCAQIVARYLSGHGAVEAFDSLLPRIIPQYQAAIKVIHFDPKESLWSDPAEKHVRVRPVDESAE